MPSHSARNERISVSSNLASPYILYPRPAFHAYSTVVPPSAGCKVPTNCFENLSRLLSGVIRRSDTLPTTCETGEEKMFTRDSKVRGRICSRSRATHSSGRSDVRSRGIRARSNETEISYRWRERALTAVEVWKSSQRYASERPAVSCIAWLDRFGFHVRP